MKGRPMIVSARNKRGQLGRPTWVCPQTKKQKAETVGGSSFTRVGWGNSVLEALCGMGDLREFSLQGMGALFYCLVPGPKRPRA